MATLLDIKARIKAVANIIKITKAMQLVAAAKFTRAQTRARSARPYTQELDGILGALAGLARGEDTSPTLELSFGEAFPRIEVEEAKLFEEKPEERPGVVLVTSDRGLCGAFNTRLIRAAQQFMNERSDKNCRLITLGRKGHSYFRRRDVDIVHREEGISDKLDLEEIRRITGTLVNLYVSGEVDAVYLIFAKFKSAMVSTVTTEKFLSIPRVEGEKEESMYILEPDRDAVFQTLIPLYATTKIFAALADSFASEYGARMTAMQLATKNAEEMLDSLVITRNKLRQAVITKELAEIVGGAEALK